MSSTTRKKAELRWGRKVTVELAGLEVEVLYQMLEMYAMAQFDIASIGPNGEPIEMPEEFQKLIRDELGSIRRRLGEQAKDGLGTYPIDTYIGTGELRRLLAANGKKVTAEEIRAKGGRDWDGSPNDHKWYEALDHYGVPFPEEALENVR